MAEVIKICENSWRIEDGFVRFFLLSGSERAVLVDSGMTCPDARRIAQSLTDLPVEQLLTHADPDHISGCGAFEKVLMHPAEEDVFRRRGGLSRAVFAEEGQPIDLGGRRLEIIHIPGHTPGSIAVLDPDLRVLLTGDSVQTDNIFMFGQGRSMEDFKKSLKKLIGMKDRYDRIWPSHGSFPTDPGLADMLLSAIGQIEEGRAEGTVTEHRGTKVMLYRFPFAGIICDMK